jgi:hypothetical protein
MGGSVRLLAGARNRVLTGRRGVAAAVAIGRASPWNATQSLVTVFRPACFDM